MPSEAHKKRDREKREQGQAKRAAKQSAPPPKKAAPAAAPSPPNLDKDDDLECDSLLTSDKYSHDVEISIKSLTFRGEDLVTKSTLKLGHGRKYGLVSSSRSGKSVLFRALTDKSMKIPLHMEVCPPLYNPEHSHLSVREYVTSCNEEIDKIEHICGVLAIEGVGDTEAANLLSWRHAMLEDSLVEHRAFQVLHGLGFDREMQETVIEKLEDRWHMAIALAKALVVNPAILLLDEPTHYLDLYALIWLSSWLNKLNNNCILIVKSNDVEFLSEVCDNFIDLHNNNLKQYDGTYEDYSKSKEVDLSYQSPPFHLANAEKIMPPFLQLVALEKTYPPGKVIFNNANLDIDLNSRIALIGVKGAGKTTLLNILAGDVVGGMSRSSNLRIGHFDQVLVEKLELDQSVRDYVQRECHAEKKSGMLQFWLSSSMCRKKTRTLMHDQKASLAFACLAAKKPHLLLIDDPTKFMDFESIESLAMALKNWEGAFVLVSNNIRLINAALCDVWVCGSKELLKIESNITELSQEIKDQNENMKLLEDPTAFRGFYPRFAIFTNSKNVTKFAEAVHPSLVYEEYIDGFKCSYKPNCIRFGEYKKQIAMVTSAPTCTLAKGDMQIEGEMFVRKTYRMTTDPGKLICKSLLDILHESESMVECLSDFDESHVWVSPDGRALLKGPQRKKLCKIQLRRNRMSIHKIISDMCSEGGAIPPDTSYLLDMIKNKPEMSYMYHIQCSLAPISQTGPLFMRMQEHLCRDIKDVALKEHILLAIPYVEFGEWHGLFTDNYILRETYYYPDRNHVHSAYILPPLPLLPTPQEIRERQIKEADLFLLCLRNRAKHRLDYLRRVTHYLAQGSDLATHARFSLVNCVLQEELERAKETKDLKLHEFL